eukprot:Phypoly_transcript_01548.p1 GENE.Phypoly_transcript_01548~~Phypoly_transcript_01548.p1  ORF type:complete len:1071 (+),score=169.08 Phypoly_transcript_01548:77-3289(+)
MRMRLELVVVLVMALAVMGMEVPCTYTDAAGNFYDLSPLSMCGQEGYTVNPPSDGPFVINICNTQTTCGTGAAVCQMGQYNVGSVHNITFSDYSAGSSKGVTLEYGSGDNGGCPNNRPRTSVLNLICDASAATPVFNFTGENPTCSYNFDVWTKYACPVPKAPQAVTCPVYVYLVPHTHDDVGWILTIDGYYQQQVKHILDTTVASLMENPDRKFIYVEQAYFWRWWTDPNTTDTQRDNLRTLYKNGQWEFVIGGWVMQDEACTTYGADIEQMTLGHQFLYNNFGAIPVRGWQIDPFGQSSVTPTLEKLAGFKTHLIDRTTYKPQYQSEKKLQFNWYGSPSLGDEAMIFTEIMDGASNAYCDWYFEFGFNNDPVNTTNVAAWAQKFYDMVDSRTGDLLTNVMLAAWGCDFQFQNATPMFHSMDILVNYLQQNQDKSFVYVKYATLSEYYDALLAVPNVTWPENHGNDFFPLFESLYWTGYFTSRVALKGLTRQGEAASHVVEPLYTFANAMSLSQFNAGSAYDNIMNMRMANGDAQHHDGVTGTSVPDVVQMYETDLINGMVGAYQSSAEILSGYISKGQNSQAVTPGPLKVASGQGKSGQNAQALTSANNLLTITKGQTVPVVIYNSLGWTRNDFVVIPANTNQLSVVDSNNAPVPSQVNPSYFANATGSHNLFFQVNVPPFGFQTYFVMGTDGSFAAKSYELELGADTTLTNELLSVTISGTTGRISNITNIASSLPVDVDQNLFSYTSQHSGAYAFAPAGFATALTNSPPTTIVNEGPLVTEVFQTFNPWAKQNIRMFTSSNPDASSFVELDFELGVLPSHTEVITHFSTSIQSQQLFSTDDNGFEFLLRQSTYENPIEGNYYPTIYATFIRDYTAQLTVISERSHGCSSLDNGDLEVMVHRNPDMGDGFGPGLTDTDVVYPVNRILLDTPAATTLQVRKQPYLLNFPLTYFTGAPTSSVNSWKSQFATTSSFISGDLPANVHLLSFNPLNSNTTQTILRLTHLFALGEDPILSKPATVDVATLFSNFKITSFTEVTLTANQVIQSSAPTTVELTAKQIRTFIVEFS